MDVCYKIGKFDFCFKVVVVVVEYFVVIDGVENGLKFFGYYLYFNKGVFGEYII